MGAIYSSRESVSGILDNPATKWDAASDKRVLCQLCGVKSLDFFDTLHPPPKSPGNTALQAGELAGKRRTP